MPVWASPVAAQPTPVEVAAPGTVATAAAVPAVLRASFVQERRLPGFRSALRSEGEVLLVRGEGLRWRTREPFPSTLIVRGNRMWFRDAADRRQDVAEGGHVAGLVQELLGALLSGDRAALSTRFRVREAPPVREGAWALALEPIAAPLDTLYAQIELSGAEHVERIVLHERNGAKTTIDFAGTRVQAEVGDAERRALD